MPDTNSDVKSTFVSATTACVMIVFDPVTAANDTLMGELVIVPTPVPTLSKPIDPCTTNLTTGVVVHVMPVKVGVSTPLICRMMCGLVTGAGVGVTVATTGTEVGMGAHDSPDVL